MSRDQARENRNVAALDASLASARGGKRTGGGIRARLELAALEASGELGYRGLTVQAMLDRTGASRTSYYREFANKSDCYSQGYAHFADALAKDLLDRASKAGDWIAGLRGALWYVADLAASEPALARGLIEEVHVAGGAALEKRKDVFERLSRAIDSARRENESRHSPPPIAADFILSAMEAAVVKSFSLGDPKAFAAVIPDLVYIAVAMYFGDAAAKRAAACDLPGG